MLHHRIEAGLLTPETKSADDKKSGSADQPFDEKREKALKKKEKVRFVRECSIGVFDS